MNNSPEQWLTSSLKIYFMPKIQVKEYAFGKDMNRTIYYKDIEDNGFRRGDDGIIYDDNGDVIEVELEVVKEF